MFQMSSMQLKGCAAAALFTMLLIFEVVTRLSDRHKIKTGQVKDLREGDTFLKKHNPVQQSRARIWCEGLLIIAAGLACVLWFSAMRDYQRHGAFYDQSWRVPGVEGHFHFTTADTDRLQAEYDADPEGFDFTYRNAILVKLGCEDCEAVMDSLEALYATGGYDVIFSNSEIGKAYVDAYGVTFVPSVIYSGTVIELRGGSSAYDDGTPVGGTGGMAGELEDWLKGSGAYDDGPGTTAGENAGWGSTEEAEEETE